MPRKDKPVSRDTFFSRWALPMSGALIISLAAFSLWGELHYSLAGVPATGKVIAFHYSQSRSISITAEVEVSLPGAELFHWEVEDAFATQQWEKGASVPLLCARIHEDHMSCVVDSSLDRFLFPAIILPIGGFLLFRGRRKSAG